MGALLGMIAPPVSIPAMIICAGVDIPYVGFTIPLLICTVPLAAVFALTMIYPHIRGFSDGAALEEQLRRMEAHPLSFRLVLPVLVLVALFAADQIFAGKFPGFGMPLIFLLSALSGLLSGVKFNVVKTAEEAVDDALPVMGILMGVGMFIQIMTLIGMQGFIVVSALSLPLGCSTSGLQYPCRFSAQSRPSAPPQCSAFRFFWPCSSTTRSSSPRLSASSLRSEI